MQISPLNIMIAKCSLCEHSINCVILKHIYIAFQLEADLNLKVTLKRQTVDARK